MNYKIYVVRHTLVPKPFRMLQFKNDPYNIKWYPVNDVLSQIGYITPRNCCLRHSLQEINKGYAYIKSHGDGLRLHKLFNKDGFLDVIFKSKFGREEFYDVLLEEIRNNSYESLNLDNYYQYKEIDPNQPLESITFDDMITIESRLRQVIYRFYKGS